MRNSFAIVALLAQIFSAGAFVPASLTDTFSRTESLWASSPNGEEPTASTRRQAWVHASQLIGAFVFVVATPAFAAKDKLQADKEKLQAGYKRLSYLMDNWEKETTNCKTKTQYSSASSECERTPLNVQNFLGYKSTEDPLFRADKTMRRLEVLVPAGEEVAYLEAMEQFNEKVEEASGMSYVSSWGESNPGGGKDRVEYFVERARVNALDAKNALGNALKILDLL